MVTPQNKMIGKEMKSWFQSFYKPVDCFSKFAAPSCHKMQLPRNNYYYKMQDTEFDNLLELLVKVSSKWIYLYRKNT